MSSIKINQDYMAKAIDIARKNQTAYGCTIVHKNGEYIEAANQTKLKGGLAHAEIEALIKLREKNWDPNDLILYTTGEPCPMCMGAIMWHGIKKIAYGVPISKIKEFQKQIELDSITIAERGWQKTEIVGDVLYEKCISLWMKD